MAASREPVNVPGHAASSKSASSASGTAATAPQTRAQGVRATRTRDVTGASSELGSMTEDLISLHGYPLSDKDLPASPKSKRDLGPIPLIEKQNPVHIGLYRYAYFRPGTPRMARAGSKRTLGS